MVVFKGYITGLSGLSAGTVYFLSAGTAGALTATPPSTAGQYVKPMLVALSASTGLVMCYRGNAVATPVMLTAYKDADESRNTTTVLADDGALTVALAANTKYFFKFLWWWTSASATPDFKFDIAFTGTTTNIIGWVYRTGHSVDLANIDIGLYGGSPLVEDTTIVLAAGDTPGVMPLVVEGTIEVGASGGNLKMRWAQNTSNGTDVTVKRGSSLIATVVG